MSGVAEALVQVVSGERLSASAMASVIADIMGRHAQEEQLADPEAKHVLDRARAGRQGALEAIVDQSVELAQTAQRGGYEQADKGAVALCELLEARCLHQQLVQRTFVAQNPR